MSVKLNFKINRDHFNQSHGVNINQYIKNELEKCFTSKGIQVLRIYPCSYKYIKVLLATEKLVDDVFNAESFFCDNGFKPALTMPLKTARTVFCFGFDPALLGTHDNDSLKQLLIDASWKVVSVYILQSKRAMKIEFKSRVFANKFLEQDSINMGGIRLEKHHMEPEVDPSIDQCYNCGALNPGHPRELCPNRLCCLRCGYQGHAFHECQYIPNIPPTEYTELHKSQAYFIACASGHCSLNHRACPTKKSIIKSRILDNRAARNKSNNDKSKHSELSKQIATELSNLDKWPKLSSHATSLDISIPMSAIITLAMIEEAHNEGSFQLSLDKACEENKFPKFKYKINHGAAVMVMKNLCANPLAEPVGKPKSRVQTHSLSQPQPQRYLAPDQNRLRSLRSVRDTEKNVAATNIDSDSYTSDTNGRNKRARVSPLRTTNIGAINDVRNRLEEQTYIINTTNVSEVSNGVEEIAVNNLLNLYETANSELSNTKRQIIEGLLKQAVDMDREMKVNANIIRVAEDFH